jgi:hypothetical protein
MWASALWSSTQRSAAIKNKIFLKFDFVNFQATITNNITAFISWITLNKSRALPKPFFAQIGKFNSMNFEMLLAKISYKKVSAISL